MGTGNSELNDSKPSPNTRYPNYFINAILLVVLFSLFHVRVYKITRKWAKCKQYGTILCKKKITYLLYAQYHVLFSDVGSGLLRNLYAGRPNEMNNGANSYDNFCS
jgi:hypothetical protein